MSINLVESPVVAAGVGARAGASSSALLGLSGSSLLARKRDDWALAIKEEFSAFVQSFTGMNHANNDSSLASSLHHSHSELQPHSQSQSQHRQPSPVLPYMETLMELRRTERTLFPVNYTDLAAFSTNLCDAIHAQFLRLEPFLCEALKELVESPAFVHALSSEDKAIDVKIPSRYFLSIAQLPRHSSIRELATSKIGALMSLNGTVTRTSQVRPELLSASFTCGLCGLTHTGIEQQFKFTQPTHCQCGNRKQWRINLNQSVFTDWQSLKLQENAAEIPPGSMPRSVKVILRSELVESCKPGDKVIITGSLIVVPEVSALSSGSVKVRPENPQQRGARRADFNTAGVTGIKELGVRELNYTLVFLASHCQSAHPTTLSNTSSGAVEGSDSSGEHEMSFDEFCATLTAEQKLKLEAMHFTPRLYTKLIASIAPTIHGHEEIKRGLLLMLLGGVHKVTGDNSSLRGDINVCIVGDPSTSKSQFLKYVCEFLPRAVYTSGKASSAAGLTASVVRDVETGEFAIEAGALMLADNGICCIDEFDKMEITDQVAIHEAMEQQTISIAKAGIHATLNARTSVLAAANPIRGRYDRTKTLKQNVDISAPIMSRFDLFFVVLDEQNDAVDFAIASHIINVHCSDGATTGAFARQSQFSLEDLQLFVRAARTKKPRMDVEARQFIVDNYVLLRSQDSVGVNKSSYRITVRQLESMIRLSEARARLDLSDTVQVKHVHEAARLLKKSIVRVETGDLTLEDEDYEESDQHNAEEQVDESLEPQQHQDETNDTETAISKRTASNSSASPLPAPKPKFQLRRADYVRISLELRRLLRRFETDHTNVYRPLTKQSHLIQAYCETHSEELTSDTDIEQKLKQLELILELIIKEHKILVHQPSKQHRAMLEQEEAELDEFVSVKKREKQARLLLVHPNFDGEDDGSEAGRRSKTQRQSEQLPETGTVSEPLAEAVAPVSSTKKRARDGQLVERTDSNVSTASRR